MRVDRLTNSFWRLQIAGWLVYLVLIYITFFSVAAEGSFLRLLRIKTVRTIIGFVLTCILWRFYRQVVHRFSIGWTVAVVLASSAVFGVLWTALESVYGTWANPAYDLNAVLPRMPRIALDYAVTIMAWSAIYFGIKYWQKWREERERALESLALANKAQLEMLRYQLNPHFLFNALNSIRASIDEDSARAKGMITQLSEFLRHSLLSVDRKENPLSEELEAVRNYLGIEKTRFEEKLEVEYDIDESAGNFIVPSYILNPLVENAIKHGWAAEGEPLSIKIKAAVVEGALELRVANTGELGLRPDGNGTGLGLKNVRQRLAKLYPGSHSFDIFQEAGRVCAAIRISRPGTETPRL